MYSKSVWVCYNHGRIPKLTECITATH